VLHRFVAPKFLPNEVARDPQALAPFNGKRKPGHDLTANTRPTRVWLGKCWHRVLASCQFWILRFQSNWPPHANKAPFAPCRTARRDSAWLLTT